MSDPLVVRLVNAFADFLGTATSGDPEIEAARQAVVAATFRRHDEDTPITPESDTTKGPRIIVTGTDNGRVKPYTNIRILRMTIAVRALTVTPGSTKPPPGALTAAQFNALCGALERLLDFGALRAQSVNGAIIVPGLTSETRQIATMLCTRQPGTTPTRYEGGIRTDTYALDIRAIASEYVLPTFDNTTFTFDSTVLTFDLA